VTDFDIDTWLDNYQPRTTEAEITVRYDLLDEHQRLELKLAQAGDDEERRRLAEKIVALEDEIGTQTKVFTFHDIGGRWLALIGEHPPTKEQVEGDANLDHNPETFPVHAIAESSIDPKLTVRQVERLREKLRLVEWQKLWAAVLEANLGVAAAPKSLLAGAVLRLNGVSATTPVPAASPEASS
jgi:hypothetical protein